MAEPPEMLTLVLVAGGAVRVVVRTLGRSDISDPEAEGGVFGFLVTLGMGSWRAAGLSERREALGKGASCCGRRDPAM